ncbi:MAG TPA: FAD-dependent oxidoreductase [Candidatus Bathyarchaeia archaeon]|nr:FAD-dependent oxidoreductase [Candidatus Bathyarchaeia archaeon]
MPPIPQSPITRRQFLRRLGIATGATLGLAPLYDLRAIAQPARPIHVVIVGAGLAGLCAALELERRGHTCTILEAETTHVGGRARTLRFETGLYGEAGAMRVPKGHALPRHYVTEFGLSLSPFVQSNPEAFYFVRGRRERIKDVLRLNPLYALSEAEREKSPDDLWAGSLVKRLRSLTSDERAELASLGPASPTMRGLDQQSLQQLFETEGLSPDAIEFLAVTYGMEMLLGSAVTEHLREEEHGVWTRGFDEIAGGTDRLPAAFVTRLKSKPRMGAEVVRLEQDAQRGKAAAVYRDKDNRPVRVEGDFVLCTLPFPVLSRLEVEPAFSGAKQRAIRELSYDSSTKVLAVTRRRFWEEDDGIFGGGTYTDLPTGTTWYPSNNAAARDPKVSGAPAVFLASYSWGQAARRLATLPHAQRSALALTHLARVHPQLSRAGEVRRTASWSWDNHRWSGGAFAWFTPGQWTALHRHVIAPEGRIYFAGEHTSLVHTWMQGALESGLIAVRAMLTA